MISLDPGKTNLLNQNSHHVLHEEDSETRRNRAGGILMRMILSKFRPRCVSWIHTGSFL